VERAEGDLGSIDCTKAPRSKIAMRSCSLIDFTGVIGLVVGLYWYLPGSEKIECSLQEIVSRILACVRAVHGGNRRDRWGATD
jgi:hypothetical protein